LVQKLENDPGYFPLEKDFTGGVSNFRAFIDEFIRSENQCMSKKEFDN